jgi:hypothetical protein
MISAAFLCLGSSIARTASQRGSGLNAVYKKLESKARKATPRGQSGFLISWIVEHASPDQRKALFRSAPPVRIVYRLVRRRLPPSRRGAALG